MATLIIAQVAAAGAGSPDSAALQLTGLFMQSCVQFAGDKDGLRGWARSIGLQALPAEVQDQFLGGVAGLVFDASNQQGKFVLVSDDGGSCSAIAENASGKEAIVDLEKDLKSARIAFSMTAEKGDSEDKLQHREYVASRGDRGWQLSISTVKNEVAGQVMLTASGN